jgi:hypothetical protein
MRVNGRLVTFRLRTTSPVTVATLVETPRRTSLKQDDIETLTRR